MGLGWLCVCLLLVLVLGGGWGGVGMAVFCFCLLSVLLPGEWDPPRGKGRNNLFSR